MNSFVGNIFKMSQSKFVLHSVKWFSSITFLNTNKFYLYTVLLCALWHINSCGLLDAESCLYILYMHDFVKQLVDR